MKKTLIIIYILINIILMANKREEIKNLKVGFIKGFSPYYVINEDGNYDGFGIEVIKELLKDEYNIEIIEVNGWKEGHEKLMKNKIDVIPNMGIIQERKKDYLFSIPYEDFNVNMFINNSSEYNGIKSIEDIRNKKKLEVGVVDLNVGKNIAQNYNFINIRVYRDFPDMFLDFINEDIPVIIYPENVVNKNLKRINKLDDFRKITPALKVIPRAMGVNKNNTELLLEINKELSNFIGSKKYNEIYSNWFISNSKEFELSTKIKIIILILSIVILISIMFIILLKKLVDKKTKELNKSQKLLKRKNVLLETKADRRAMELNNSRDYIETLFHGAQIMILTLDQEEKIINANKYFEKTSGYKLEDIKGKNWYEVLKSDKIKDIVQGNKKEVKEATLEIKNGKKMKIQWHNSKIYNEISKKEEILAVGIDITERKRIEKSLKESERRFKALHNASFGGIAIHDKGVILDCNQGLSEMTGYSIETLIGMDGLLLIAKESRELVMDKITSGFEKPYEAVGLRKSGEEYPLRLEARNIPYKGKQVRVVEFRDITENIQAKKELIVSKVKAEKANQAKSDFLANMSHELRTPLNAILGFSSILKDMEEDEEKKDMASLIEESGDHLLQIINDILNLSKIESGQIKVNLENFKLEEILDNLAKTILGIIKRKNDNIKLNIIKENDIPEYIKTDKLKIKQILMNLLSNAEKFTEEGKIEIRVKYLEGEKLRFQVIDTGVGIAKKDQEKIFKEFIQGEHYMTKMHEGTGLGLAINLRLIDLLGGHIELESEEGKGSTFTVIIPIEEINLKKMDKKDGKKNKSNKIYKNKKVIIAEDDIINQKLIKRLCINRGLEIVGADNGIQLLEKLKKEKFDLILMDIQMPEMDGITATKEIRKRGLQTPIIAITAFAKKEDEDFFLETGMDDYISKPIDRGNFQKMIDKYLDSD